MTQPIARKRALELAETLFVEEMHRTQLKIDTAGYDALKRLNARYAELAAALAYIENLARQKELL